eukprot:SM000045S16210  [mRNA]  locus=s45:329393:330162:+ [translate_table: standard]
MGDMAVDGEPVSLKYGKRLKTLDAAVSIELSSNYTVGDESFDIYVVSVRGVADIMLKLRPATAAYRRPDNAYVHFSDLEIREVKLANMNDGRRAQHNVRAPQRKQVPAEYDDRPLRQDKNIIAATADDDDPGRR